MIAFITFLLTVAVAVPGTPQQPSPLSNQNTIIGASHPLVAPVGDTGATSSTSGFYVVSTSRQDIRIRRTPVDGTTLAGVTSGDIVEVIESPATAEAKIGVEDEWIKVRTADGIEGYTAAWLYDVYNPEEVSPSTTPFAADAVFITTTHKSVRVRSTPVNGSTIAGITAGDILEVLELPAVAEAKIGVEDEWIKVRTADGIEGYTAAWLYERYTGEVPHAVVSDDVQDLMSQPSISVPQIDQTLHLVSETTIEALGVIPQGELEPPPFIAALENSIAALNIPEVGSIDLQPPTIDTQSDAIAGIEPDAVTSMVPTAPEATDANLFPMFTSEIAPITVDVIDSLDIESAELTLNNVRLQTFTEAPFTYELDTNRLEEGDYRLTFAIEQANGVTSAGTLDFEIITVDNTIPLQSAEADSVAPRTARSQASDLRTVQQETTVPEASPVRIILVDGERQSLDLAFSMVSGLTLKNVPGADITKPTVNLVDILTSPAQLIPEPIRAEINKPRPMLSTIIIIIMTMILLPQGLFTIYWMLYTWNNPEAADKYRSPKTYREPEQSFTAILPARHEEDVIRDTIMAVDRIDYPEHLKEILVVIRDEDDDATIAEAQSTIDELGKDNIKLITFTNGPRNKPNGLNRGLRAASNNVVCIFDAEDEPHPDIYNVVNTVMLRDDADVVQSGVQLMNFRSTWFSALNCLEYFFWFKSGLHAFTREFKVTPLGGNTVFFKKHWMEQIGGWDEACLTEDADVGIRLTNAGAKIQIVYDAQHATQEETPADVDNFIKQRTRWNQGFYQIFFKGDWLRLPTLGQKLTALYILTNSLLQVASLCFIPVGLYIALTQQIPVPIALMSYLPIYILFVQLVINLIGIGEFTTAYQQRLPFLFRLKMAAIYYPYQLLLSISAVRAMSRAITRTNAWEKTAHANLHRQSQSARA